MAFTANKPETAELLSRMAGDMTVHMEQRSYRGERFDLLLDKQTISMQQTRRRLLTPDEAMRLPPDDALIFVAGHPPVRATKIRYYQDEELSGRAKIPPPSVSDVLAHDWSAWLPNKGCLLTSGRAHRWLPTAGMAGKISRDLPRVRHDLPFHAEGAGTNGKFGSLS